MNDNLKIYEDYLKKLNAKMKRAKWNIIIFVENCPIHFKNMNNYSNIKVHFLILNSTSVLQLMNQGVIEVSKQIKKQMACEIDD